MKSPTTIQLSRNDLSSLRHLSQEKDREFWSRESRFYIRLLRECKSISQDQENRDIYQRLINQFQHFQDGAFDRLNSLSSPERLPVFNPLSQGFSCGEGSMKKYEHAQLKDHFQKLKEESFQKIGRFFTVKIQ